MTPIHNPHSGYNAGFVHDAQGTQAESLPDCVASGFNQGESPRALNGLVDFRNVFIVPENGQRNGRPEIFAGDDARINNRANGPPPLPRSHSAPNLSTLA
jgi:hypothetical protein